ncbi:hypothetical protein [Nitrospira sp. Nam74]
MIDTYDPRETLVSNFSPIPGMGSYELAVRASNPGIRRLWGSTTQRQMTGPGPDKILCPGAAVGVCEDGRVRHIRTYNVPQEFAGFYLAAISPEKILVYSRGTVRLLVDGLENAKLGDPVYVTDINKFSIERTEHALMIGEIRSREEEKPGWCLVAFKSFHDTTPFLDPGNATR